jgi:2-polyprenyl-3-methyl-5-hydroxy-6-metoxy-1,4-benzoquinol methylase
MWNERYNTAEYIYGEEPNAFLAENYQKIPKGRVLCLAEGEGRNAVFLARQGYDVTAVDQSDVGLEKARKLAAKHGVSIHCIHADLADFDLGNNQWEGIVSIFCHVPQALREGLHSRLTQALKRGGVFLLEAYTPKQLDYGTGGPPIVELMMSKTALESELSELQVDLLEEVERDVIEGSHHTGKGAVVQAVAVNPLRQFQVSSNRGGATHKVRYVESGGGAANSNCTVCKPTITPRED